MRPKKCEIEIREVLEEIYSLARRVAYDKNQVIRKKEKRYVWDYYYITLQDLLEILNKFADKK